MWIKTRRLITGALVVTANLLSGCSKTEANTTKPALRTVVELPEERFDTYAGRSFPHAPWTRLGTDSKGVSVALDKKAESQFIKNTVNGRGMLITDTSTTAGTNEGFACAFAAPPAGSLFLSFDFKRSASSQKTAGVLPLDCRLGGDKTASLSLSLGDTVTATNAAGQRISLFTTKPEIWYHLAVAIQGDAARFSLRQGKTRQKANQALACPEPAGGFRALKFLTTGTPALTGTWAVDSIYMAGKVDVSRNDWFPFVPSPKVRIGMHRKKVFAYGYIYGCGAAELEPGLSHRVRTFLNPASTNQRKPGRKGAGTETLYFPLPRVAAEDSKSKDQRLYEMMAEEVRQAIKMGLDGFQRDFHTYPNTKNGQSYFTNLSFLVMDAAVKINPDFKIIPQVYSSTPAGAPDVERAKLYAASPIVQRILKHPASLRTPDGRVVFSMWRSEKESALWWKTVIDTLKAQGTPIAFVPHVNSLTHIDAFSPLSYGMAHWGPRTPTMFFNWIDQVRGKTEKVIFPVCPQDVRTRGCTFWESGGSEAYRAMWETAIHGDADWVFINTWSDYTEQAMAPSTSIGYSFYDLGAYYTEWFKSGMQPEVKKDVLYYFYRVHHRENTPRMGDQWKQRGEGGTAGQDQIELLAFLKEPGLLRITLGTSHYVRGASKGMTSFKIPLPKQGSLQPVFSVERNGKPVLQGTGRYTITDTFDYKDMMYHGGVIAK